MSRTGRSRIVLAISLAAILLLVSAFVPAMNITHAEPGDVTQVKSGRVASDSLTTGNTTSWTFGGEATILPGAKFTHSEDAQGLHIGVQAGAPSQWTGFYAVTQNTSASLFHAFITLPYTSMPKGEEYNTGLYVQTSNKHMINYIGCLAVAFDGGPYFWTVNHSFGPADQTTTIETLYQSTGTMPLAQDCTIITNGNNFLKVYLGGQVVVNRDNLTLSIPPPFNAYLEVETTSTSAMRNGTYTDYYATLGEDVTVSGAPPGGKVQIEDSSGGVLVSSTANITGVATLNVGQLQLPLSGYFIRVYDVDGTLIGSTPSAVTVWGGDVYTVSTV
ncbi:MAG: hypothetical protein E6K99_08885 [Thaumarchaeota archaeon]|nr:MAG: hypothetical protein E6K99_08885 [Nitrososphaerota archaeon]